jgi:hypothetical protein
VFVKLHAKERELEVLTAEKDKEIAVLQKRVDDVRGVGGGWHSVYLRFPTPLPHMRRPSGPMCSRLEPFFLPVPPPPVPIRQLAHSPAPCVPRVYRVQASGSVQMSEGMSRLAEAAAAATTANDLLTKQVAELEEKARKKDKRIQTLAQNKAEAEAQLNVRPDCCIARVHARVDAARGSPRLCSALLAASRGGEAVCVCFLPAGFASPPCM